MKRLRVAGRDRTRSGRRVERATVGNDVLVGRTVNLCDGAHHNSIRDKARDEFAPGKFVAPHSAIFDHAGNIFVVEWVEVGRVTKLRKIA